MKRKFQRFSVVIAVVVVFVSAVTPFSVFADVVYSPIYKQSVVTIGNQSNPNAVSNYPSIGSVPLFRNLVVNTSANTIASEFITNGIQNRVKLSVSGVPISQGVRYVVEFDLTHFGGNNSNSSLNDFSVDVFISDYSDFPQNIPLNIGDYGVRNTQIFDFVAGSNMSFLDMEFITNYSPISSGWRQVSFYNDFRIFLYDDYVNVYDSPRPDMQQEVDDEIDEYDNAIDNALGGKSPEDIQAEVDEIADQDFEIIGSSDSVKLNNYIADLMVAIGGNYLSLILFSCTIGLAIFIIGKKAG